jgi:hypothetical protein
MRKCMEKADGNSCLNKADDNELIFVLLGRDVAAAATIRFWTLERIRLGKNKFNDQQIQEALSVAETMERERERR